ncbi:MAG: hypothetical protein CMF67_12695 [Magnetovibrio sp.]|nr:hypothetical protein [Magnetovibrio sp.]|tara:strand:- start:78 stop:365 length:288 start_codon:yes stop_codon:yes gene_type:complete
MLSPHWLKVDKSACEFINLQIRRNDGRRHYLRRSESEQCRFIIGLIPFRSADSTAFPAPFVSWRDQERKFTLSWFRWTSFWHTAKTYGAAVWIVS